MRPARLYQLVALTAIDQGGGFSGHRGDYAGSHREQGPDRARRALARFKRDEPARACTEARRRFLAQSFIGGKYLDSRMPRRWTNDVGATPCFRFRMQTVLHRIPRTKNTRAGSAYARGAAHSKCGLFQSLFTANQTANNPNKSACQGTAPLKESPFDSRTSNPSQSRAATSGYQAPNQPPDEEGRAQMRPSSDRRAPGYQCPASAVC